MGRPSALRRGLGRLPVRWRWSLHNLIAHPASELLYQVGAQRLANAVHDETVPHPHGEFPRG